MAVEGGPEESAHAVLVLEGDVLDCGGEELVDVTGSAI